MLASGLHLQGGEPTPLAPNSLDLRAEAETDLPNSAIIAAFVQRNFKS